MSLLLAIIGWLLVGVLGLLAALLLVPLHLEAAGQIDEDDTTGQARVRWGWWLVVLRADMRRGVRLQVVGVPVWRLRRLQVPEKKAKKPRRLRRFSLRGGLAGLRHRRVVLRLVRTVWRAIPVRGRVVGTIGLRDPAQTAVLFGVLDSVTRRAPSLDIRPDWLDPAVSLAGSIRIHIWPPRILAALLWMMLRDGKARRGLWALMRRSS